MILFAYNNSKHESTQIAFNEILKKYLLNLENAFKNKMLKEKTSFAIERAKILCSNRDQLVDL